MPAYLLSPSQPHEAQVGPIFEYTVYLVVIKQMSTGIYLGQFTSQISESQIRFHTNFGMVSNHKYIPLLCVSLHSEFALTICDYRRICCIIVQHSLNISAKEFSMRV